MCCPYKFIFSMIQKQFKAIEMNKNAANCLNPPFISQPILNLNYIMRMSEKFRRHCYPEENFEITNHAFVLSTLIILLVT